MARYKVRFVKNLCDDTGHQHKCLEGIIKIRQAKNEDRAARAAKHRFARMKRIPRWDLHADFVEVEVEEIGPNEFEAAR
jgi:hypothetical protein